MCLDYVDKTLKPCRKGYKIMRSLGGQLVGDSFNWKQARPVGEWLDEKDFRESSEKETLYSSHSYPPHYYPTGWHIYHRRRDAEKEKGNYDRIDWPWLWVLAPICGSPVLVSVRIQKPVAVGKQDGFKVTVAKRIKIVSVEGK
jgi:hypothetical protein